MILRQKLGAVLLFGIALGLIAAQCGPPPEPEYVTIVETVIIDKVIETVEIVVTREVKIETITQITPTPTPLLFEESEINLVTSSDDLLTTRLLRQRRAEFEAATGTKINLISNPLAELHDDILFDLESGTNNFDGLIFPSQWLADYVVPGYLENITGRIAADEALEWNDVAPLFRDISSAYGYTLPIREVTKRGDGYNKSWA